MNWYSMILWRKPEKDDATFEEIAKRAYDTLVLFNELPENFRPNYQTVSRKKDAKEFNWDYACFYSTLKKKTNIDAFTGVTFGDLGYRMSFFSSLKSGQSFGYSIGVGSKSKLFSNTFIVDSPVFSNIIDEHDSNVILKLFESAIDVFQPYWGCVINEAIEKKEKNKIDIKTRTSKEVHWLTYWADEYVEIVGKKKLETISQVFPKAKFHNGLLKLQNKAFDVDDEDDIQYLRSVRKYLID